jgi:hypothetical protein
VMQAGELWTALEHLNGCADGRRGRRGDSLAGLRQLAASVRFRSALRCASPACMHCIEVQTHVYVTACLKASAQARHKSSRQRRGMWLRLSH